MGKEIVTKITIDAPSSKVWNVLLDFDKYSEWNPFLSKVEGTPSVGEILNVTFSNGFNISPKLIVVEENKQFKWAGKLACGGLFDGQHRFILTPSADGTKTELEHGEEFSGILIPFMSGLLRETEANFQKMNEALKKRAEESA